MKKKNNTFIAFNYFIGLRCDGFQDGPESGVVNVLSQKVQKEKLAKMIFLQLFIQFSLPQVSSSLK